MSKPSFNKISQDRAPDTKKMNLPIEEVYYRKKNQFKNEKNTDCGKIRGLVGLQLADSNF